MKAPALFASGTTVPVERSRAEIERLLVKYGATAFTSAWDAAKATIGFAVKGWHVRFELVYPDRKEPRFRRRTPADTDKVFDAEVRRLWRSLSILLKAKLDCVQSGITTFEREFLADLVIPGQSGTVGQIAIPQLAAARKNSHVDGTPHLLGPAEPS